MYFNIFLVVLSLVACSFSKTIDDDKGFNPQPCNKTNHGKIKLFKDRQSNDKLLFCTVDHGFYSWKAVDGSQSRGEFFDPAYDCSDVLNNVNDARDGFYWINFGIPNKPRKVWCDMTSDGGGYMLIGRKRNASMWSVPSNDETVKPFGTPHWTSDFGDAPVLDFRVQMATKESFSDTKAHWSFRLKAKRLLKNLLIIGEKGCDQSSAGIGNIAYVKDLQTENIVTTNFQCSIFGIAHHSSLKFGWSMMNSCLQKPCSNGFAFLDHPNIKLQTDTSGAFRKCMLKSQPRSQGLFEIRGAGKGPGIGWWILCFHWLIGFLKYSPQTQLMQSFNGFGRHSLVITRIKSTIAHNPSMHV